MNGDLFAGAFMGLLLVTLAWLLIHPALGGDPLKLLARFVGVFLLKLVLVVISLISLAQFRESNELIRFAVAMLVVYLAGTGVQLAFFALKLRKLQNEAPQTSGNSTE